jgi:two-component system CheB/CheR fusion protein
VHAPTVGASVTINRELLSAYDSLLGRVTPCGFLVNAKREVLHYFGDAADFCVNVSGRARLDLPEQLDERLRLSVISLMRLAEQKKTASHLQKHRLQNSNWCVPRGCGGRAVAGSTCKSS